MRYLNFLFVFFILFSCKKEEGTSSVNKSSMDITSATPPYKSEVVVSGFRFRRVMFVDAHNNIYVALRSDSGVRVRKWLFGSAPTQGEIVAGLDTYLVSIEGIFVDKNGVVYLAARNTLHVWNIIKYMPGDKKGKCVFNITTSGFFENDAVVDLKVNSKGAFYIALRRYVIKWVPGDQKAVLAEGNPASGPPDNRPGIQAIDLDLDDALYTSDGYDRIEKWESGSSVSTIIAKANQTQCFVPTKIAVDENKNVYVSDLTTYNILKFAPGSPEGQVIIVGRSIVENNVPFYATYIFSDKRGSLYTLIPLGLEVVRWTQ